MRCGAATLGMLLASSSASSISSCAGHASGGAGRLLRQSSLCAEEMLALSPSSMRASSSSGCSVLGMVGDSEKELWTETASFASSSAGQVQIRGHLELAANKKTLR